MTKTGWSNKGPKHEAQSGPSGANLLLFMLYYSFLAYCSSWNSTILPSRLCVSNSFRYEHFAGEDWWDLCAGPHLERTGQLNRRAIELEFVAGAYWRGDEKRQMLQRIYGTAWESEEQLKFYQVQKEEAKRRDHRRLGQDLNLFSIQVMAI